MLYQFFFIAYLLSICTRQVVLWAHEKAVDGDQRSEMRPLAQKIFTINMKVLEALGDPQLNQVLDESIIDRVIKKMAGRAKEGTGNPLTQGPSKERSAVDLAAIGLNADMASTVTADEKRFSTSMKSMSTSPRNMASSGSVTKKPELDMSEKLVQEQSNKVHFYIRAIQGEQLVQQERAEGPSRTREQHMLWWHHSSLPPWRALQESE